MSVIMMLVGALSTAVFHVDRYGVKLLPKVEPGLPKFKMLDFSVLSEHPAQIITLGLTVALVIVSSTLLTACNYAIKNDFAYFFCLNFEKLMFFAIIKMEMMIYGTRI